jgi:hypothetical protein
MWPSSSVSERKITRSETGEDVAVVIHSLQFVNTFTWAVAGAFSTPCGSEPGLGRSNSNTGGERQMSRSFHYIFGTRNVLEFECLSCIMFNRTKHPGSYFPSPQSPIRYHGTCLYNAVEVVSLFMSHFLYRLCMWMQTRAILGFGPRSCYKPPLLLCEPAVQFTCVGPRFFFLCER